MKKQALSLAVLVAGAYPAASNALSLGDIRSNSSLNQPLRAKIELLSANAQETRQLQVRLAPSNVFSRVGVDRPAFLNHLRFRSTFENGKPVILVTSDTPISEPFVNFLLEVSWPNGQLLKEYTVMLNPPVLMQPGTALAGNEAAVRAEPRPTGVVNRAASATAAQSAQVTAAQRQQARQQQQQVQQQQQARQQQRARQQQAQQQAAARTQQQAQQRRQAQQASHHAGRTYRVRRGDTLFKVATRLRQPGVNTDQMMMALYRANPGAFIGKNINGLKAGAILRTPSAQAAGSSSRAQARRQVRQQYVAWKRFRSSLAKNTVPQKNVSKSSVKTASTTRKSDSSRQSDKAHLEVLGKTDKAASSSAATGSAQISKLEKELALARESLVARQRENSELKSRVADLQSMLRKKTRLIELRDDQLAKLQKQLAQGQGEGSQAVTPPVRQNATAPGDNSGSNTVQNQPQQQNTVPRTGEQHSANGAGRDIQNQVANTRQAEQNRVVRAQPDNTENKDSNNNNSKQLSTAEKAAQQRAENLRRQQEKNEQARTKTPAANTNTENTDPVKPASPFMDEQEGDSDLMSLLTSPMAMKIGAGALASLLLLWLLSRLFGRRKGKEERIAPVADESMPYDEMADTNSGYPSTTGSKVEAELDKAEQLAELDDDPFGTRLQDDAGSASAGKSDHLADANGDSVAQEEDEVLMEANVYIAYGLYQQAESELKKALDKHPERLEYRHKLLENYFTSNNREAFDRQAEAFLATPGADRSSKMWQEIAGWGAKISPDNPLYQQSAEEGSASGMGVLAGAAAAVTGVGAAAAALSSVDSQGEDDHSHLLADEDKQSDLSEQGAVQDDLGDDDLGVDDFDFDLDELETELGNLNGLNTDETHEAPSDSASHERADNDLDTADTQLQVDDLSELASTVDDSVDFSLDDLAGELEKSQRLEPDSDRDIAQNINTEMNELAEVTDNSLDFDALLSGTDEQAATTSSHSPEPGDEGSGLSAGLAAGAAAAVGAVTAAVVSSKDKAEEAVDGAGQTLDELFDGGGEDHAATDDDFALPGDLDDTLSFDLSEDTPAVAEQTADGLPDTALDEFDFNLDDITTASSPADHNESEAAADQPGSDNVTNLNLHLDQDNGLRKILPQDTFYASEDEPQNERVQDETANDEDSWLGDIDDALSFLDMPDEEIDLHEAHISTKLDLARAYLDMGDIEGARSTLEEVMVEGNDNQRREAENLLHETG